MKQMVILSGKGGTGKTTVAAALAHLMSQRYSMVLADADVDAPNLGLILDPENVRSEAFFAGVRAEIDEDLCIGCGTCQEVCRFDAIVETDDAYAVVPVKCEGCATCFYQCPADAIRLDECLSGHWHRARTRFGPFVHALLCAGEENSGKLVAQVREQANTWAEEVNADWVLIDGSPGIGCPVIAAVTGVDMALLVCEPTVSGVHDLERVMGVTEHFGVPALVCINKSDINETLTAQIEAYCAERKVPVVAKIPYDEVVISAMRQRKALTELPDNPVGAQMRALWSELRQLADVEPA